MVGAEETQADSSRSLDSGGASSDRAAFGLEAQVAEEEVGCQSLEGGGGGVESCCSTALCSRQALSGHLYHTGWQGLQQQQEQDRRDGGPPCRTASKQQGWRLEKLQHRQWYLLWKQTERMSGFGLTLIASWVRFSSRFPSLCYRVRHPLVPLTSIKQTKKQTKINKSHLWRVKNKYTEKPLSRLLLSLCFLQFLFASVASLYFYSLALRVWGAVAL